MIVAVNAHHLPCVGSLRASVILLHGYSASGAVHRGDGENFVDHGTEVLLPDAPGHGHRHDGRLIAIGALAAERRFEAILELAREWAAELPSMAAACRERGALRVGLVGISMGGFVALGALGQPCAFDAVAALLAAPDLVDSSTVTAGRPPLLLGLAGRDCSVSPEPGRVFARDYGAELREYPESEHCMREADWFDLWACTGAFLRRHLGGA